MQALLFHYASNKKNAHKATKLNDEKLATQQGKHSSYALDIPIDAIWLYCISYERDYKYYLIFCFMGLSYSWYSFQTVWMKEKLKKFK